MGTISLQVFCVFLSGLLIGSFLNVCICRVPKDGQSLLFPSSSCSSCGNKIAPQDLIPVASFLLLRGRCRTCGGKINRRYICVELTTGLLFSISYLHTGLGPIFYKQAFLISFMVVAAYIDWECYMVPNKLVCFGLAAGSFFLIILKNPGYESAWWGVVSVCGFLFLLMVLSGGGLGFGDVKLAAVIGILLGWPLALVAILLSCCLAGITGVLLYLLKKKHLKDTMPFVPFMSMGSYISMMWGEILILWYFLFVKY